MMTAGMILFFTICGARGPCEEGFIMAKTCQEAQQHAQRGMRPGQRIFLTGCEERRS